MGGGGRSATDDGVRERNAPRGTSGNPVVPGWGTRAVAEDAGNRVIVAGAGGWGYQI